VKRATIIGLSVGSAALIAAAGVTVWALLRPAGPTVAAEEYLNELEQRRSALEQLVACIG
jgi:hypothetical protein